MVTVIGAAIVIAGRRSTPTTELLVIAMGTAFVLMLVDIPPIYLTDAAAEAVLIAAWGIWLLQRSP